MYDSRLDLNDHRPAEARMLGTRFHAITAKQLIGAIDGAIARRQRLVIGHHNLHSLALCQRDAALRRYYDLCDLVYADGMSAVALARALRFPFRRHHRLTSLDFVDQLLTTAADAGWRVFYLGSEDAVISEAMAEFRRRAPGINLAARGGYFDMSPSSADSEAVLSSINGMQPDLLIVGMGMPRQEHWIRLNAHRLTALVILPIGALADYLGGAIPTPPRWSGALGLEWAFRLLAEPRRLGHRYLVEPWVLLRPLLKEFRRTR
jgi:N-acetylglucosaminyldiphosphoundecaprenol N-acetyl-beta-D-mannosaminyltransferase